jgi:hypothetical protein
MRRPATETLIARASSSSLESRPCSRKSPLARCAGLKSFGKATPLRRTAASFSRRSAMCGLSWLVGGRVWDSAMACAGEVAEF